MSLSMPVIIASVLFGSIGFVAFMYGKKQALYKPMTIGIVLMAYPYFVSNTIAVFAIGAGLTAALFIFKD